MTFQQLVKLRMEALGINNNTFVRKGLNYKNVNKGMRKFQRLMNGQELEVSLIPQIAKLLEVPEGEVVSAMLETAKEQAKEQEKKLSVERNAFVPYFYSVHENKVPSPIFVGNITHNLRFVRYHKDMLKYSLEEQLKLIRFGVVAHYQKHGGGIAGFGKITHYIYRHDFDAENHQLTALNIKGDVITGTNLYSDEGKPGGLHSKNNQALFDQLVSYKKQINDNRG
ncbi:hypothetical protein L21SP5_03842 [Salinivirga cyanobacteriivorans]|uniref:Uncharacterized protein n=1 Tax=Salinivirga cyanobacteriivorans TaxID=1307839 RepID=A0A0S2I5J5_9BACT|nr:hypothetical protein [Salinivirga cyanobacteriivorans]ALO17435.1 hypothetical protein L21SP5_03842 [Salinivirga cyanobacteriivorans]